MGWAGAAEKGAEGSQTCIFPCVCCTVCMVYDMNVLICEGMQRPEENASIFLTHSPPCSPKIGSPTEPDACPLSKLAAPWAPRTLLPLHLCICLGLRPHTHSHAQLLTWVLGIWTEVFILVSTRPYSLHRLRSRVSEGYSGVLSYDKRHWIRQAWVSLGCSVLCIPQLGFGWGLCNMEKREGLGTLLHRSLNPQTLCRVSLLLRFLDHFFLNTPHFFSCPFYFSRLEILHQDLFSFSLSEAFEIKLRTPWYSSL